MDYIKTAEQQLNNFKETMGLTELLPDILRKNKIEVYTIQKVLEAMESEDKEIIQRICIDGEKPKDLTKLFGVTVKTIYKRKGKALKSFTERLYGTSILESGGKK